MTINNTVSTEVNVELKRNFKTVCVCARTFFFIIWLVVI